MDLFLLFLTFKIEDCRGNLWAFRSVDLSYAPSNVLDAFELADQILTEDSDIEPDEVEFDEENDDNFHSQLVEESLQSL